MSKPPLPLPSNNPSSAPTSSTDNLQSTKKTLAGKLTATVLSTYDLPNDVKPLTVQMECHFPTLDESTKNESSIHEGINKSTIVMVETGPPVSRHRDSNSFKFVQHQKKDKPSLGKNELIIDAPLSELYPSNVVFRVKLGKKSPDLVANVNIASTLRINESHWLILNLANPDESAGISDKIQESKEPTAAIVPTLRIKMHLSGTYRSEISSIISLSKSYFSTIDQFSSSIESSMQSITKILPEQMPSAKILLVPTVPIATICVVASPIVIGILIMGLPFFLPLLLIIVSILLSSSGVLFTLYYSTPHGRSKVVEWVSPLYTTFLATPSGQRFIYNTGPRPTPVQMLRLVVPTDMMGKLGLCLLIDFVGSSSYLIPLLGESTDLVWAPLQSVLIAAMFDEVSPNLKYVSFLEEILPFTDVIPTATMGWIKEFGPSLLVSGKDKIEEMRIVLRREKNGLEQVMVGNEEE